MEALQAYNRALGFRADVTGTGVGIAAGILAFGIYSFGHRHGLIDRNIRVLCSATALFSLGMLVKGIYGVSYKINKLKKAHETFLAIQKDLFSGTEYSFDALPTFSGNKMPIREELHSPVMKWFDVNGNPWIFIRVRSQLTDELIKKLPIPEEVKAQYTANPTLENTIVIAYVQHRFSTDDYSFQLKQGFLDSSTIGQPAYCSGIFTHRTTGQILDCALKGFNALKQLLREGQSQEPNSHLKLIWQLDKQSR
jgi:hypothetical protein